MQILSVQLKNIKSHRDSEFHFAPGINVLSGPNGAGKSTIFEAIGYALFGVDARDFVTNVDRFLTIGSKRGEVAVTFRVGDGGIWRVTRTVGAATRWLLAKEADGRFEVEEHAGTEETEARIASLLGLDKGRRLAEQFKLVIGPFQSDFLGPFVIRQATRRKDAFDEILGIDTWRKTFDGTLPLLKATQEKIKVLAADVSARQEQVVVLPEKEAERLALQQEVASRQGTLAKKETALQEVEKQLGLFDSQEKEIHATRTAVQLLENRIGDGEGKVADQTLRVLEAETARGILEKSRGGKDAFEKAEATLQQLRARERLCRDVEREVAALDQECSRLTQAVEHERKEIASATDRLDAEAVRLAESQQQLQADANLLAVASRLPVLRREVERLRVERGQMEGRRDSFLEGRGKLAEGVCPFFQEPCQNLAGRASRDVITTRVEELDRQLLDLDKRLESRIADVCEAEKAQKDLDMRQARSLELDKQVAILLTRRDEIRQRVLELEKLQVRQSVGASQAAARKQELLAFTGLETEIARTEQARAEHQAARDLFHASQKESQELENRQQTLEKWQAALSVLKNEYAARQAELHRLLATYDSQGHEAARLDRDCLVGEVATLRQQLAGLEMDDRRLVAEIGKLKQVQLEIDNRLAEQKSFEEKEKLVAFLRNRVFKNVSAQLSDRFREEITLRADRIYRTIAEADEELVWGENYQIVLRDMAEGEVRVRSDDQLSGGQMMSAVVALRLALLQTIGARIAFFDEPTSNLDVTRRENLAHAFRAIDVGREEVTEHWYDQLFLISHDVAFTEVTDQMVRIGD